MAINLPELPYAKDALAPYISANTLEFHHGKHHKTYVDNLNKLIAGTDLEGKTLEEIIKIAAKDPAKAGIFNNAAQVWNHSFYWKCLKPQGGGAPTGAIAAKINATFGSYDKFVEELKNAGATQFGSGWAWLVVGRQRFKNNQNAECRHPAWPTDRRLFSPLMSGNMLIILIIRIEDRIISRRLFRT